MINFWTLLHTIEDKRKLLHSIEDYRKLLNTIEDCMKHNTKNHPIEPHFDPYSIYEIFVPERRILEHKVKGQLSIVEIVSCTTKKL